MLQAAGLGVALGGKRLLADVSLEVGEGEALALVGESGSGKTTLLRACLGLLPGNAGITGSLRWRGCDLLRLGAAEWRRLRRSEVAWIPQEPSAALDPRRTAAAHLRASLPRGARADELWRQAGLARARRNAYPHEWSGGMQQRLLIAMALARRPRLLLADEPTSALDALHQARLLALLERLRSELGFGLLLVTHDLSVAAAAAGRVVVLRAGRVIEQGRAAEVFAHPRDAYTADLIRRQPRWPAAGDPA